MPCGTLRLGHRVAVLRSESLWLVAETLKRLALLKERGGCPEYLSSTYLRGGGGTSE